MRDYKDYEDLSVAREHICQSFKGIEIMYDDVTEHLFDTPKEILISLSVIVDTDDLPIEIYRKVRDVFIDIEYRDTTKMYSNDFERDIIKLKEKVDYIAKLSSKPVTIKLPKSLPRIKTNFYLYCVSLDIPSASISDLFKIVFNSKLHRKDIEEEIIKQEADDMLQRKISKEVKSWMNDYDGDETDFMYRFANAEAEIERKYELSTHYTGNPN